jgi:hypothetical protein
MTRVIFDISMSLDGYMTASNVSAEEPLGDGGQRLHDWALVRAGRKPKGKEKPTHGKRLTGSPAATPA